MLARSLGSKPVRKIVGDLLIGALIVIVANMGFFLATLAVDAVIPHSVLRARLTHFVTSGQITAENWPRDLSGNKLDRYSDCTGLSLNLIGPVDRSPQQMLSDADIVGTDAAGKEACAVLVTLGAPNALQLPIYKYFRYWHGYQILTKPLLLFLELKNLRTIISILYIVSIFSFFFVTVHGIGRMLTVILLGVSFVLLTDAENLDGVLVHNIALTVTFLGAIGMYQAAARGATRSIFRAGLIIAACIGFFDENYVPPLAAMSLAFAALSAVWHSGRSDAQTLAKVFGVVLFAWACGYLGTMVLRVVVSALLRPDSGEGLHDFVTQFLLRVSGEVPWEVRSGIFAPVLRNVKIVVLNPFFPVVVVGTVVLALERIMRGWRLGQSHVAVFYLLTAVLPLPWYMMFWQYSVIHNHTFYRWAAFGFVCVIATFFLSLQPRRRLVQESVIA